MFEHLGPVGKFIKASTKYIGSGFQNVDNEMYTKRMSICFSCDKNKNGICEECKCILHIKAKWVTENCPLYKWPDDTLPLNETVENTCGGCGK